VKGLSDRKIPQNLQTRAALTGGFRRYIMESEVFFMWLLALLLFPLMILGALLKMNK